MRAAESTSLAVKVEFARQCAWCLCVAGSDGRYGREPRPTLIAATHGICPRCAEVFLAEADASAA